MMRLIVAHLVLALIASTRLVSPGWAGPMPPERLSDQQFWSLSKEWSEEDGVFRSDNLLSNESSFQNVIPTLLRTGKPGGAYLGVGPEQNFTYIAALKPAIAIIIDIRHGNLDVQLLYKALFELSKNRADFVSRLFSRQRPKGLTDKSTAAQLFGAYLSADGNKEMFEGNLKAIADVLINKHKFPLTAGDLEGIRWALANYYRFGPGINYNSSLRENVPPRIIGARGWGFVANNGITYATLMTADDGTGEERSYLANEKNFKFIKDLESRNLIVPVVGDFGGERTIRSVGRYLKTIDTTVSNFYLSNVEQYLAQDDKWNTFCASAATLPLHESSSFIRSGHGRIAFVGAGVQSSSTVGILEELMYCPMGAQ